MNISTSAESKTISTWHLVLCCTKIPSVLQDNGRAKRPACHQPFQARPYFYHQYFKITGARGVLLSTIPSRRGLYSYHSLYSTWCMVQKYLQSFMISVARDNPRLFCPSYETVRLKNQRKSLL